MLNKILFDLDGTLTDPKIGITKSVQYALKHFGIETDSESLTPFIGPPLIDSFMEFYGFSQEQAREAVEIYRERFAPIGLFENEVYEGIPEMLEKLKEKGMILAVASSKPEPFVEKILEHFDLRRFFDVVVGSLLDETRTSKEDVLDVALTKLGAKDDQQNTAMVGDRKFDIKGAKAYGLVSIGVSYGYADDGELENENPDYIADSVTALEKFLLE